MNAQEKKELIQTLRNLEFVERGIVEEETDMGVDEIIQDIEQPVQKKGLVYYSALVSTSAGWYGAKLFVLSSVAAPMVLTISAVAGVTALTGYAAKKFLADHSQEQ